MDQPCTFIFSDDLAHLYFNLLPPNHKRWDKEKNKNITISGLTNKSNKTINLSNILILTRQTRGFDDFLCLTSLLTGCFWLLVIKNKQTGYLKTLKLWCAIFCDI